MEGKKEKDENDSIAFILFIMIYNFYLIRTCKYDTASRWFTCNHTFTRFFVARNKWIERNTTNSCFGFFLNLFFCFGSSVPMSQNKSAFFDFFFKFIVGIYCCNLGITICLLYTSIPESKHRGKIPISHIACQYSEYYAEICAVFDITSQEADWNP